MTLHYIWEMIKCCCGDLFEFSLENVIVERGRPCRECIDGCCQYAMVPHRRNVYIPLD